MMLIYGIVLMSAFCAFTSLAVDFGRLECCKTQLRMAADAAARAAAGGLSMGPAAAQALALKYAQMNEADGLPVTLDLTRGDVQIGEWVTDPTGKIAPHFVVLSGQSLSNANAVLVSAHRSADRGTALPLMFGRLLGAMSCDVSGQSIAVCIPAVNVNQNVPATANPFLSGMPAGSVASEINPANSPDYAGTADNPMQSPIAVGMTVNTGDSLSFNSITGTARHDPNLTDYEPDGETDQVGHNNITTNYYTSFGPEFYNENGIADMNCPINALVGVFLDDNAPNSTPAPSQNLDFSTDASRNFSSLHPQLKQLFFIGDGLQDDGTPQTFVAPKGATRLFLATWDFYQWNNNLGERNVQIVRPARVITVE
jgi:hypothetical protein